MKLTLGFSPCPNDTFIFDALVNNKIDTGQLKFEVILEDVETLNKLALNKSLDVTKVSYGVLPLLLNNYIVLNSGSALGKGVGPILISNKHIDIEKIKNYSIAIPGENTTAHMLFNLAFPEAKNKIFLRYNEIEDFVLQNSAQVSPKDGDLSEWAPLPKRAPLEEEGGVAGVIIHENRFTYQQKGLIKIIDLGEFWEQKTQLPIPLGGIVAKRNIDHALLKNIDSLIKQSVNHAFNKYPMISEFVRKHSQEIEDDVMRKHIDSYVNDYSIELGETGEKAITELLKVNSEVSQRTYNSIFLQ